MKTAIIYESVHHMNTKKVADAMAEERDIDLYTTAQAEAKDFSSYGCIGFASGIYMNTFHPKILKIMEKMALTKEQKVFLVYTCGFHYRNYAKKAERILRSKKSAYSGCFWCRGYDTYALLKKIGGIAKGRPNENDLSGAKKFISQIV